MESFRDKYEKFWRLEEILEKVKSLEGDKAINNLQLGDIEEVFRLSGYFEGDFVYASECGMKEIIIDFNRYQGLELFEYMTIRDIISTVKKNDFIQITLYEQL